MAERTVTVDLVVDTSAFLAALARAQRCVSYMDHLFRHHMPEDLALSAMHAAYDRRRRARRRRS